MSWLQRFIAASLSTRLPTNERQAALVGHSQAGATQGAPYMLQTKHFPTYYSLIVTKLALLICARCLLYTSDAADE